MKTKIILVTMLMAIAFGCSMNINPGTGQKIGQVVKISKTGIIVETWEAQLIRGGMSGGSGSFGTVPFDFTVENEEMAKKVQEFMNKQTEVIITYRAEGVYGSCRSDSGGHFLTAIAPAPKP